MHKPWRVLSIHLSSTVVQFIAVSAQRCVQHSGSYAAGRAGLSACMELIIVVTVLLHVGSHLANSLSSSLTFSLSVQSDDQGRSQEFHLGGGINFNSGNFAMAHTGTISKNNQ